MIARRFSESLSAAGAEEIAAEGEAFDPSVHEAIMQLEDADRPAGTVISATQRGFRVGDRLVRAASRSVIPPVLPTFGINLGYRYVTKGVFGSGVEVGFRDIYGYAGLKIEVIVGTKEN